MNVNDALLNLSGIYGDRSEQSGGPAIPTPTIEDEGRVLSVNSHGEYEIKTPGQVGQFIVVAQMVSQTRAQCNATREEIDSAIREGKIIIYHITELNTDLLASIILYSDNKYFAVPGSMMDTTNNLLYAFNFIYDGNVYLEFVPYALSPAS